MKLFPAVALALISSAGHLASAQFDTTGLIQRLRQSLQRPSGATAAPATAAPAAAAPATPAPATSAGTGSTQLTDYLFVYFTGEGLAQGESISMSVTNNGNLGSMTAVNGGKPLLISNVGTRGVRDPSLIVAPDRSKFWIVATDLKIYGSGSGGWNAATRTGSKSLIIWESSDLKTWSAPRAVKVSPDTAGMTWAPDAIWDPSRSAYMVFWVTNLQPGGWTFMRSFTKDFKTFTTAERYNALNGGMDATIAYDDRTQTYYCLKKNGPNELIEQTRAKSLDGPWTVVKNQLGSGVMPKGEGPLFFKANGDSSKWYMFIDDYSRNRGYVAFETNDIASANWRPSNGIAALGPQRRHGYMVGITAQERLNVLGR